MATDQSFIAYVCEQADLGAELTYRKMFGEYAVYYAGRVVALACDNQLFLTPTEAGRSVLGTPAGHPPFPGAKPYFRLDEQLEDRLLLRRLLQVTAEALPLPKPKAPRKSAGKARAAPVKPARKPKSG